MTQPESRLQRAIQHALMNRGAFVFKVHGSQYMMTGLPDLVLCYRGWFVALEVKMPGNDASPAQKLRIKQIRKAGGRAYVVRSVAAALKVLMMIDQQSSSSAWSTSNNDN